MQRPDAPAATATIADRYPRATPRPWEALDADGEPNVYPWVGWTDSDGQIVSVAETEDADAIDRDNVRLIVAAVNEYEALLAVESAARDTLVHGLDHPAGQIEMMDGSFKPCPLCLALDQLKALRG